MFLKFLNLKVDFLSFKYILPSLEYATLGARIILGGLVSSVDNPIYFQLIALPPSTLYNNSNIYRD